MVGRPVKFVGGAGETHLPPAAVVTWFVAAFPPQQYGPCSPDNTPLPSNCWYLRDAPHDSRRKRGDARVSARSVGSWAALTGGPLWCDRKLRPPTRAKGDENDEHEDVRSHMTCAWFGPSLQPNSRRKVLNFVLRFCPNVTPHVRIQWLGYSRRTQGPDAVKEGRSATLALDLLTFFP